MLEIIGGIIGWVVVIFIFGLVINAEGTIKLAKKILQLSKESTQKSLDYTSKNTSKVRDYAIIVVCIAVVIALIAFFAK